MSTANKYQPPTNTEVLVPLPCCPHCKKEINPGPALFNWAAPGPSQILAAYCPNIECRSLLHMQIVMVPEAPPSVLH